MVLKYEYIKKQSQPKQPKYFKEKNILKNIYLTTAPFLFHFRAEERKK